ncbi:MAG: hypothetical protein O2800_01850 [Planctomycetota bacterium]|nr:hypothetical protein [Planctomycetota bacterium]
MTQQSFFSSRRGNTLVLVTAILVLLAIVAAAYLSRTQAGRATAAAQQKSSSRGQRIDAIADNISQMIGDALFTRPADPSDPWLLIPPMGTGSMPTPSPSRPRGFVDGNAHRYNIDTLDVFHRLNAQPGTDGIPEGYNYAPFVVQPWTNWPDIFGVFPGDGNPAGNPGFGDSRWLRSTEPTRQLVTPGDGPIPNFSPFGGFTHWQHLSWLPTADNGWRLITDLKDVDSSLAASIAMTPAALGVAATGAGWALDQPYEQWLPDVIPAAIYGAQLNGTAGSVALAQQFRTDSQAWFSNYLNRVGVLNSGIGANPLPNLFRLASFGVESDDYVDGSARNLITRTLADADGDGFTDSYWFLAPTSADRGVRQAVAVSITDNAGLVNANVATRFDRRTSFGATPADVALVTTFDLTAFASNPFDVPVGFFTDPDNSSEPGTGATASFLYPPTRVRFDDAMYGGATNVATAGSASTTLLTGDADNPTLLRALGVVRNTSATTSALLDAFREQLLTSVERVRWFKAMGSDGEITSWINPDETASGGPAATIFMRSANGMPPGRIRPFDESDELELRMSSSSNNASVISRFERAVQRVDAWGAGANVPSASHYDFLRASGDRLETLDALEQQSTATGGQFDRFRRLNAVQLLRDNRRKLTLISGSRNELMPPWLWTVPHGNFNPQTGTWAYSAGFAPGQVWQAEGAQASFGHFPAAAFTRTDFLAWNRKVDLRKAAPDPVYSSSGQLLNAAALKADRYEFLNQVSRVFERALLDRDTRTTYFGIEASGSNELLMTRRMIASWAANLECFRDSGKQFSQSVLIDQPFHPAEGYTIAEDATGSNQRIFIGQEKQPYIQEVFFALVYPKSVVPPGYPAVGGTTPNQIPFGYPGGGEHFVAYDEAGGPTQQPAIVMAVQIANPHQEPITLTDFAIRAFGQTFRFAQPSSTGWGYGLGPVLGPATETTPRSAIVFACPKQFSDRPFFRAEMMDFLDITHDWVRPGFTPPAQQAYPSALQAELLAAVGSGVTPWPPTPATTAADLFEDSNTAYADTLVFNATIEAGNLVGRWEDENPTVYKNYLTGGTSPTVELIRRVAPLDPVIGPALDVVVDRIENDFNSNSGDFRDVLARMFDPTGGYIPPAPTTYDPNADPNNPLSSRPPSFNGVRLGTNGDFFCTWVRVARPWAASVDPDGPGAVTADDEIQLIERVPRYVIAAGQRPIAVKTQQDCKENGVDSPRTGSVWASTEDPDGLSVTQPAPWFVTSSKDPIGRMVRGKPTRFSGQGVFQNAGGTGGTDRLYPGFVPVLDYAVTLVSAGGTSLFVIPGDKGIAPETTTAEIWKTPLDMSVKDGDFEQIAEIANVFQWGPVITSGGAGGYSTYATFSEIMSGEVDEFPVIHAMSDEAPNPIWKFANRLSFPYDPLSADQSLPHSFDPTKTRTLLQSVVAFIPPLPAGCSLFDGFTIDDRGAAPFAANPSQLVVGATTQAEHENNLVRAEDRRFRLAMGYQAEATPGMVNLNTALLETIGAMPFMTRLVLNEQASGPAWATSFGTPTDLSTWSNPTGGMPYVRVPSSLIMYRDLRGGSMPYTPSNTTLPPLYTDRGLAPETIPNTPGMWDGMRRGQGIWSLGELALMTRTVGVVPVGSTTGLPGTSGDRNWSIQYAALDPYDYGGIGWNSGRSMDARVSLDRTPFVIQEDNLSTTVIEPTMIASDGEAGTAEEANMLLGGIMNSASVRSDIFTVHFIVRTFRQNSLTGRWNATDPTAVLDESRYVMLVDRSNIDKPGQKPRILYFAKAP